jgi:cytolysin-activating lysine-acyltransferase
VAFASWAYLTEEAEGRLLNGARKLSPVDWKAGDRLWMIDLICPFGGAEKIVEELANGIFRDQPARTLVPDPKGGQMKVVQIGGKKEEDAG